MGSGATSRLDLEFPLGTDPAAIPTDIEGLAAGLDGIITPWIQSSSAPVSPIAGQLWWNPTVTASTFGMNYYDGTVWWNTLTGPQFIGTSAPSSSLCYPGFIWINTSFTCAQLQICTAGGSSPTWLIIVPGSNTTNQTLINTGSGIQWGSYSDATKLPLSGGTLTGPLILSGNPSTALGAAPKQYVDAVTTALNNAVLLLVPLSNNNITFTSPLEPTYVTGTAPASTMNIYVSTNSTSQLITSNAANNWIFNVAATSGAPLNNLLVNNSEITIAVRVKQGTTPYYCTGINIDGVSQTVNWQGGAAPAFGYASGYDIYTINIVKTATSTYSVFAALTQF
jgi:hypothetical protein